MLKKNARVVASDPREGHRVEVLIKVTSRNGLVRDEVQCVARNIAKDVVKSIASSTYINLDELDTRIYF